MVGWLVGWTAGTRREGRVRAVRISIQSRFGCGAGEEGTGTGTVQKYASRRVGKLNARE